MLAILAYPGEGVPRERVVQDPAPTRQGGKTHHIPAARRASTTPWRGLTNLSTRWIEVRRIRQLTPRVRRVEFAWEAGVAPVRIHRFAATNYITLSFPDPATGAPQRGSTRESEAGLHERSFTVRAVNPDTCELSVDFVCHGRGIASDWARDAAPGNRLLATGPAGHTHFPQAFGRYVFAGDDSALPAIARAVDEAPPEAHVTAVLDVATEEERQPIRRAGPLDLRWTARDTNGRGGLERSIRKLHLLRRGAVFVFVAGEAAELDPIRRYLCGELGLSTSRCEIAPYWTRADTPTAGQRLGQSIDE